MRLEWEERFQRDSFSIEAAAAKGRKQPDWLAQEPALEPGEDWLLSAFYDLTTCRIDEVIPWRDMIEYADRAGLDRDVGRAFVRIIRRLDTLQRERHERTRGDGAGIKPSNEQNIDVDVQRPRAVRRPRGK